MRTMPPEFLYNHNWTLLYRTLELIFSHVLLYFKLKYSVIHIDAEKQELPLNIPELKLIWKVEIC